MTQSPPDSLPDVDIRSALIVGTGLMGTSVALALRAAGVEVYLRDRDPAVVRMAAELGAGLADDVGARVDLAVLAVPPAAVAAVLAELQSADRAGAYTDLGSTKGAPQRAVEAGGRRVEDFVGGHPLAGRERSGPGAGRADLFEGRPWVLTPGPATSTVALAYGVGLARRCGAAPVLMSPDEHDRAVALVSHAPQLLASLAAARLVGAEPAAVALAGQGLRDLTRIAASDPGLWQEILRDNAAAVADVLSAYAADLDDVVAALRRVGTVESPAGPPTGPQAGSAGTAETDAVARTLRAGNLGRALLPGKHGQPPARYAAVPVVVPDRPGELARLFTDAGDAGVNIEDLAIEHSLGQPVGLVELKVRPPAAPALVTALRARGWTVHREPAVR